MRILLLYLTTLFFALSVYHSRADASPDTAPSGPRLLRIDEAYRLARQNNPTLEAMQARVAVLDATQRRLDAQIALTRARYTRDLARLAIAYALGTFDPGQTVH